MSLLAIGLLAVCAGPQSTPALHQGESPKEALALRLQEAAWLPTRKERAAAAKGLAKDKAIKTSDWLEAIRGYASYPAAEVGIQDRILQLESEGKLVESALQIYVPAGYDPAEPTPLLILLHGSGGTGPGILQGWTRFAGENGYLLLAPTDPDSAQGYAFTERERDLGMAAMRWMRTRFHVDDDRIHLFGVSRGGHMAWDLGLRFPDRFASVNPAIGGPTWVINGGRNNLRLVENLHRMRMRDLQLDWYVTSIFFDNPGAFIPNGNRLYLYRGQQQTMLAVDPGHNVDNGGWGWGTVAGDFDLDGDMDLAEVNGWQDSE